MSQYAILILVILLIMSIPANGPSFAEATAGKEEPLVGQRGVYSVTSFGTSEARAITAPSASACW